MPIDFRTRGLRESIPGTYVELSKVCVLFLAFFASGRAAITKIGEEAFEAD
jgi:hypothetical protein